MLKFVAILSLFVGSSFSLFTNENPMRRVINILQNTQKELEEDSRKEEDLFNKFECYCKKNNEGMAKDNDDAQLKIQELNGKVESEKAEKAQLDQDLVRHKADRATAIQDLAQATSIRDQEKTTYDEVTAESRANIDAITGAISALEKGMGSSAFLQTHRKMSSRIAALIAAYSVSNNLTLEKHQRQVLTQFLQGSSPYGAYSSKSNEIVGILKQMLEQMDKDLEGVISREAHAVAAFKELKKAKEDEIQAHTDAIESKQVRSGELAVSSTQGEADAKDTAKALEDTRMFLAELTESCATKKSEYEERSQTRAEETAAISEAIKILNDDDALNVFSSTLNPQPTLLQVSARLNKASRAASLLQSIAKQNSVVAAHSTQLSLIAALVKNTHSKADFTKVVEMIDQMAEILKQEQNDDNAQRDWCNAEFEKNNDNTKESDRNLQQLSALIEESQQKVQELTSEINTAEEEVKQLDKAVADATEQRKNEHEDFVKSQTDLVAAQQLIEKAINRLNKFYNKALYKEPPQPVLTDNERIEKSLGENIVKEGVKIAGTSQTVYAQIKRHQVAAPGEAPKDAPETWSASYENKSQKSGGVIALLTNLEKDLSNDQVEGEHEEKTAQSDFEKLMENSKTAREQLNNEITVNNGSKAETEGRLGEAKVSQSTETEAHAGLVQYLSQLHGSCDFLLQNFDVRKEARTSEIDGLVQAKAVLAGASFEF